MSYEVNCNIYWICKQRASTRVIFRRNMSFVLCSLLCSINIVCSGYDYVACHVGQRCVFEEYIRLQIYCGSVLLCFMKPILGNHDGPGNSWQKSQGGTHPRMRIADVPPHLVLPKTTWCGRILTLHVNYFADNTNPLLFLFLVPMNRALQGHPITTHHSNAFITSWECQRCGSTTTSTEGKRSVEGSYFVLFRVLIGPRIINASQPTNFVDCSYLLGPP